MNSGNPSYLCVYLFILPMYCVGKRASFVHGVSLVCASYSAHVCFVLMTVN